MTALGARPRLERIFRAAVAAADPATALQRELRLGSDGALSLSGEALSPGARLHVLAVGKAAAPMARTLETIAGARIAAGLVITKQGHGLPMSRCTFHEAGHPVPDARSERAGRLALDFVARVPERDVLLVLLSGGASSLMTVPAAGLGLDDLAATTRALLVSGAPIDELNAVRKHLSAISGGRLALAATAGRVRVLAVSDVAEDRLDVIGSGPCAADASRFEDALAVLLRRSSADAVPAAVRAHLEAGVRGELPETPDAASPAFSRVRHVVLANNATALEGARVAAEGLGLKAIVVTGELAGEARVAGVRLARLCRAARPTEPTCLLTGGETTVTVRGDGMGGRSQELALAAAFHAAPGVALLAAGTDGSDGPTDAAGAYVDATTTTRARELGLDPRAALDANDSYRFFEREGGLFRTGPTGTNVRDLVIACVEPA